MLNRKKGFTLIELMIVMAIIAILAVLGIVAIQTARRESRYAQVRDNIRTIQIAMEQFKTKYGKLPPEPGYPTGYTSSDNCSGCNDPPDNVSTTRNWEKVIDALVQTGYLSNAEYYYDPWGTYFAYDDNDGQVGATRSYLCTAGVDKRKGDANNGSDNWGTADDYCIYLPYGQSG